MKKTLFDPACSEAVIDRIESVSPTATPGWGSMNAAEMLQHCRIVNEAILSGKKIDRKPSFKESLLKNIFVHLLKRIPKNIRSPKIIREAIAQEKSTVFDDEKIKLTESVKRFYNHTEPIAAAHPVFGPMDTNDWGSFAWVHLNHHLTQFGK